MANERASRPSDAGEVMVTDLDSASNISASSGPEIGAGIVALSPHQVAPYGPSHSGMSTPERMAEEMRQLREMQETVYRELGELQSQARRQEELRRSMESTAYQFCDKMHQELRVEQLHHVRKWVPVFWCVDKAIAHTNVGHNLARTVLMFRCAARLSEPASGGSCRLARTAAGAPAQLARKCPGVPAQVHRAG